VVRAAARGEGVCPWLSASPASHPAGSHSSPGSPWTTPDATSRPTDTYERDLAVPIRLLVTDVAQRLRATIAPALQAEPTVGKSLFRINRDLRFSKDKPPYHPWIDAIWWEGEADARQAPAFIFRLVADHLVLGAEILRLRGSQLDRYRRAVADPHTGEPLRSAGPPT
jgi:uncharacterized protein (DUF2461 family)